MPRVRVSRQGARQHHASRQQPASHNRRASERMVMPARKDRGRALLAAGCRARPPIYQSNSDGGAALHTMKPAIGIEATSP